MLRTCLVIGVAAFALVLTGCSGEETEESAATTPAESAVQTVAFNPNCPMMPEHEVDPEAETAEYNGVVVGFCCGDCLAEWNEMSDEKKAEFVASVNAEDAGDEGGG
ncbi:MAG: hypothetical protein ACF8PN_15495 [Phycisphaerales bacterium]